MYRVTMYFDNVDEVDAEKAAEKIDAMLQKAKEREYLVTAMGRSLGGTVFIRVRDGKGERVA